MRKIKILWADDEIDLLKIQILFLEQRGYEVVTSNNGYDAVDLVSEQNFDIIFLDENMPGISGLETLTKIKALNSAIPVVMITKSEAEDIMDEAIGSQIADYLIKPVNPHQILLSIKKNVDTQRLITETTTTKYQQEFSKLSMDINYANSFEEWIDIYKRLVHWELKLNRSSDNAMDEVLLMQKSDANTAFGKFIKSNYISWFNGNSNQRPPMPHDVLKEKVFPLIEKGEQVFFIVIDNLRFDQWKILQPSICEHFQLDKEEIYCSILPTATQYARNALFAGMMPLEIEKHYPEYWLNDEDEGGKNLHEEDLLKAHLKREYLDIKSHYEKILHLRDGRNLVENLSDMLHNQLVVIVYNFIDTLSHSRTEMEMIKELASDESAYRSLTHSWFEHSPLFDLLKDLAQRKIKVVITTDHGTIRVNNPIKVIGDRKTTTNLRYKHGRNLSYRTKDVFEIKKPKQAQLPAPHFTSSYIFAYSDSFFAYPNNYNYYVNYYRDTFQHGGVSLEEMLIPVLTLSSKK